MNARASTGGGSPRWVSVMCSTDGRTHQIDDLVLGAGLTSGSGRLPAACGRVVVAASLAEPAGPPCALCLAAPRPAGSGSAMSVSRWGRLSRT